MGDRIFVQLQENSPKDQSRRAAERLVASLTTPTLILVTVLFDESLTKEKREESLRGWSQVQECCKHLFDSVLLLHLVGDPESFAALGL